MTSALYSPFLTLTYRKQESLARNTSDARSSSSTVYAGKTLPGDFFPLFQIYDVKLRLLVTSQFFSHAG